MANYIEEYCAAIKRGGAAGVIDKPLVISGDRSYRMAYVPFEHRNPGAKLALVSTTPTHTHVRLAATVTEELLRGGAPGLLVQRENKRRVELGGRLVRPNLIRMLDHFRVPELVDMPHAAALWNEGFPHLQPLALLPYATTRRGLSFDGPLDELLDVPMLRAVFEAQFLGALAQMRADALYIALGRTASAALWNAVGRGLLARRQVLGMLPVPARAGSMIRYFLREVSAPELSANDPVRHRTDWLDAAHDELQANVLQLRPPPGHERSGVADRLARHETPHRSGA